MRKMAYLPFYDEGESEQDRFHIPTNTTNITNITKPEKESSKEIPHTPFLMGEGYGVKP